MAGEVTVVEAGECTEDLLAASPSMVRGAVSWTARVVGSAGVEAVSRWLEKTLASC